MHKLGLGRCLDGSDWVKDDIFFQLVDAHVVHQGWRRYKMLMAHFRDAYEDKQ